MPSSSSQRARLLPLVLYHPTIEYFLQARGLSKSEGSTKHDDMIIIEVISKLLIELGGKLKRPTCR
jgi:hypothetical protein